VVIVATRQHPIHAQLRALDGGTMAMLSRFVALLANVERITIAA